MGEVAKRGVALGSMVPNGRTETDFTPYEMEEDTMLDLTGYTFYKSFTAGTSESSRKIPAGTCIIFASKAMTVDSGEMTLIFTENNNCAKVAFSSEQKVSLNPTGSALAIWKKK